MAKFLVRGFWCHDLNLPDEGPYVYPHIYCQSLLRVVLNKIFAEKAP